MQNQQEKVIKNKLNSEIFERMTAAVATPAAMKPRQERKGPHPAGKPSIVFEPLSERNASQDQRLAKGSAAARPPVDGDSNSEQRANQPAMIEDEEEEAEGLTMSQFVRVMLKILIAKPKRSKKKADRGQ